MNNKIIPKNNKCILYNSEELMIPKAQGTALWNNALSSVKEDSLVFLFLFQVYSLYSN